MINQTISHYKILEKLGGGGMGVVYKAEDSKLKRTVALKFLPPDLTRDDEAKERFVHEAQAASALDHPNICTIYEIDETEDGRMFIAMAYYEGETLKKKIERGPLPLEQAVDFAVQVAQGLAKAHQNGVTHRDIKPANVMLTEEGVAKVVDFGLAKLAGRTKLTKEGATLGTVAYMSPEQARGEDVDNRTDIWSFGVVLYEMITGQLPFKGDYDQAVMYSIMNEEPEPLIPTGSGRTGVPMELERIVKKSLTKSPGERYQDVEAMLDDLKNVKELANNRSHIRAKKRRMVARNDWKRGLKFAIPILLLAIATAVLLRFLPDQTETRTQAPTEAIAVLPFTVRGSADMAYLREAMVDLLSTKLDGAGPLRCVDPYSLLSYVVRKGEMKLDPEIGRDVAAHFGAGRYLLGTILEAGGRLQINASLYTTEDDVQSPVQVSVEGEPAQLFGLVDDLTARLLRTALGLTHRDIVPLSQLTTASMPALKAYLEGVSRLRKDFLGGRAAAAAAFRRAVTEDSTFALGWFRLARVRGQANHSEAQHAIKQAWRYRDGVSPQARLHIEALDAWIDGDADKAERLLRTIVGAYPDDFEAWHHLGVLNIFSSWRRGRSIADAREPLERALALDPQHSPSLFHLAWVSRHERKWDEAQSLLQRSDPSGDLPRSFQLQQALNLGDTVEQEKIIDALKLASDFELLGCVFAAALPSNFRTAKRLARLATTVTRSPEVQGLGHILLAYLEAAQGRWQAARAEFAIAETLTPVLALEYQAYLAAAPMMPATESEIRAIREKLARWDAYAVPASESSIIFVSVHDALHPFLKPYLLGLMSARLGEVEKTLQYATQLDTMAGPDFEVALARDYALGLRARVALAQGQKQEALIEFEGARMKTRVDKVVWTSFYQQIHERFLRTRLLQEKNRYEEALGWYDSFGWSFGYDFIYFAPMHFHRGEIYEHLGQTTKAIEHYSRFVELWRESDSTLRPEVDEAAARIARLQRLEQ